MNHTFKLSGAAAALYLVIPAAAQYKAQQTGDVVRLEDAKTQTVVSIVTSVGNEVYEMKVKGQDVLQFNYPSLDEFKSRPGLSGIPFLGPWANRLDEQAFYANGKKYPFNMELGNVRGDHPIHGFLTTNNQWQVLEVKSDANAAWVTSRLEFYRQPSWMAQFPFAHTIEITHKLQNGVLEVMTRVQNLSTEPMPLSIGFHPYFKLTDSPREEWTISVPARSQWLLAPDKIPTGETEAIEKFFPNPRAAALKDYSLDHVFGDLIRDGSGRAIASVQGKSQKLEVMLGPNYRAIVVFSPGSGGRGAAPPAPAGQAAKQAPAAAGGRGGRGGVQDRNFIAFEPMVGITDAMNLAHKGLYKELQSIAPGQTWQESFWVRPSGY
jgi:aldose 1-epimerase